MAADNITTTTAAAVSARTTVTGTSTSSRRGGGLAAAAVNGPNSNASLFKSSTAGSIRNNQYSFLRSARKLRYTDGTSASIDLVMRFVRVVFIAWRSVAKRLKLLVQRAAFLKACDVLRIESRAFFAWVSRSTGSTAVKQSMWVSHKTLGISNIAVKNMIMS